MSGHRELILPAGLPVPDADAVAHSRRLEALIRNQIEAGDGAVSFARFMELALYAPGLGYYSAGARKFGRAGDFVTAPGVSSLFGRCLAREIAGALQMLGGGDILEAGAGAGHLAVDILVELANLGSLPDRYLILETSADLRERQRQMLRQHAAPCIDRVHWLDGMPRPGFRGVVVANELLDAFPVRRFRRLPEGIEELVVGWEGGRFVWRTRRAGRAISERVACVERELQTRLPAGFESEINPAAEFWIRSIGDILAAGLVLIVDYGYPRREYYLPERRTGTLMCHYRHRAHPDPLILVGLQDITAHVDFTAVAEAALAGGLDVLGYTTQSYFLLGAGITDIAAQEPATEQQRLQTAQQIKRLTLPGEMGEIFKVIAFGREFDAIPRGFMLRDLRGRL